MIVSEKNMIKIYQTISSFYSKKVLSLLKYGLFLVKKLEIQVIVSMIMLTRSSERILIQAAILV